MDNVMTRKICEPEKDEVCRKWKRLHNEELCKLHISPSIVKMIKSRRVTMSYTWMGHKRNVNCGGEMS
jgi:hypothetical protein